MLYNGQSKTRVLIGLGDFIIYVQTHEDVMSHKVVCAQIITTKILKNIAKFVQDNRCQNNV